ncbi:MAG: iron-containing alcohol dehydrogenase [Nodosilinea sp. LVE1205-7]
MSFWPRPQVYAIPPFSISRLPRIDFGSGRIAELPALVAGFGRQVLLVTGKQSFCATPRWSSLIQELEARDMGWAHLTVSGEPSPLLVDEAVARFRGQAIDVVVGIGGGSVLDAAKAIADQRLVQQWSQEAEGDMGEGAVRRE